MSSLNFPLTSTEVQTVPGSSIGQPPAGQSSPSADATPVSHGMRSQLSGTDYSSCGAAADAAPQEIVDLAVAIDVGTGSRGWPNIFAYVRNKIDLEPTAESTKGPLGTYLDQSGNSFDQASLLVALLRPAGYSASFVVGTAHLSASQLGLNSLPQQLITDAGGSSNGTTPYAWVQLQINGTWQTLDLANKSYTMLCGTSQEARR